MNFVNKFCVGKVKRSFRGGKHKKIFLFRRIGGNYYEKGHFLFYYTMKVIFFHLRGEQSICQTFNKNNSILKTMIPMETT